MSKQSQIHREIRRNILRLRAQGYRQNICAAITALKHPLASAGPLSKGGQWLTKGKELSFLFNQLQGHSGHPLWRLLLGIATFARFWWKNKKPH